MRLHSLEGAARLNVLQIIYVHGLEQSFNLHDDLVLRLWRVVGVAQIIDLTEDLQD